MHDPTRPVGLATNSDFVSLIVLQFFAVTQPGFSEGEAPKTTRQKQHI